LEETIVKKKVLIVDDSLAMRQQLGYCLSHFDIEFIEAVDGVDGLEKLEEHGAEIFLVVLDINMPRLNGIKMLAKMRADGFGHDTIFFTSESLNANAEDDPHELGALGWLMKPVRIEIFDKVVKKIMSR
jgi:two-component system chemotaxis response regulator CheY